MSTTNTPFEEQTEEFLMWVMANRDTSARQWSDTIEPELRKRLTQLIKAAIVAELEIMENTLYSVPDHEFETRLADRIEQYKKEGKDNA